MELSNKGFVFILNFILLSIFTIEKIIFASVTLGTGVVTALILDRLNRLDSKSRVLTRKETIIKTLPHLKNLNKVYAPGFIKNSKNI
jgi:hypothetical protein